MIQNKQIYIQHNDNQQIASNSHYNFFKNDKIWILDKDIKINVLLVLDILNPIYHQSFIETLACFATTRSSSYTRNLFFAFLYYIKTTENGIITDNNLEDYFNKNANHKADFLVSMRAFFSKWYNLGCDGVTENHLFILYNGRLKKRKLGEMVKTKDPIKGPLSENDIILFNEGAMWLYEEGEITLEQLTIDLLTSYTGRRPIQTTHLKLKDVLSLFGEDKNKFVIDYPRAKHSGGFRSEFTKIKITEDLNDLVLKLATKNIIYFEDKFGRSFNNEEKKEIPLLINYKAIEKYEYESVILSLIKMDYLHIKSRDVTEAIKYTAKKIECLSNSETINARRFRYALGTRAAQEGYSECIIAKLLDHHTTSSVKAYVQNVPEYAIRIDETMTNEMMKYVNAFKGEIINSDLGSLKIRNQSGVKSGNCSNCNDCTAPVPIPCYTCIYFKPWLDAPHQDVYDYLIKERKRIAEITKDVKVTLSLDQTISAVVEVINKCAFIKAQERGYDNDSKH